MWPQPFGDIDDSSITVKSGRKKPIRSFWDAGDKDYRFNQIGNLIAGRGERPFAPTEEWRSYLILIPKLPLASKPRDRATVAIATAALRVKCWSSTGSNSALDLALL